MDKDKGNSEQMKGTLKAKELMCFYNGTYQCISELGINIKRPWITKEMTQNNIIQGNKETEALTVYVLQTNQDKCHLQRVIS